MPSHVTVDECWAQQWLASTKNFFLRGGWNGRDLDTMGTICMTSRNVLHK